MDTDPFTPVNPDDVPNSSEPDNPSSPISDLEALQAQFQEWRRATEEEFAIAQNTSNPTALLEVARKKFAAAFPRAVDRIINLVDHAEKDTTALQAARFIFLEVKAALADEDSPLNNLLKELQSETVAQALDES